MKKASLLLVAAAIAIVGFARPADALTLSPPTVEINAKPGETVRVVAKLFNEGTREMVVVPSALSFTSKNETGQPDFYDDESGLDLQHWISLPENVTLAAQERKSVIVTIAVPAAANPGGHYASVFWGTTPPDATSGTSIESRIAMLILVNVEGVVKEDAKILEFKTAKSFLTHLPADFIVRFQNNGTVHVHPAGNVIIKNMLGRQSAVLPFNIQPSTGNVLPKSIRRFDVSWIKNTLDAAASEWSKEWHNFAWGRYTAELVTAYGPSNKTATARTSFWVIPWMLTLVGLALAAAALMLLRFLIGAYNQSIIRKYTKSKSKK